MEAGLFLIGCKVLLLRSRAANPSRRLLPVAGRQRVEEHDEKPGKPRPSD